jgi:hypothetical protein
MMLSEEAEGTPSSDLLVERAAEFDVLSIGIPTSTPVMEITYGDGPRLVPRQQSDYTGNWLPELVTGNRNPRDVHLDERDVRGF